MSLISRISGEVINTLGGGTSSRTQSFGQIGRSSGASSSSFSLRSLADNGAVLFSRSALRLNDAISLFSVTERGLKDLLSVTEEMIKLGKQSGLQSTPAGTRAGLDFRFQGLIRKFEDIREKATKSGFDLLNKEDLQRILEQAGVETSKASKLVDAFLDVAGALGLVGLETIPRQQKFSYAQGFYPTSYNVTEPGGADGTFTMVSPAQTSATGVANQSVTGDFDRDGIEDLVTVSQLGTVSFFKGTGTGTFDPEVTYASGVSNGTALRAADINGDGFQDLVIGSDNDAALSVLLGNSGGIFNPSYVAGFGISDSLGLELADINNDGRIDIVNVDGSGIVQTFIGNGSGSFSIGNTFATNLSGLLVSTSLTDVNNDGMLDLVGLSSSGDFRVLQGNSNGTFRAARSFGTGTSGSDGVVVDINRDGKLDLVSTSVVDERIYIRLGNGDGNFSAAISIAPTGGMIPNKLRIADINGDGRQDLIFGDNDTNTVNVLIGNGDATFLAPVSSSVAGSTIQTIALADFDRDGALDFATAGNFTGEVYTGLNNGPVGGNGSFKVRTTTSFGSASTQLVSGDFNNDGTLDYVTVGNGYAYIALGNGYGSFQVQRTYFGLPGATQVLAYDANGDGKLDLAISNETGAQIVTLLGNGNGSFQAPKTTNVGAAIYSLSKGRVTADGRTDLVFTDEAQIVYVMQSNGDGTFLAPVSYTPAGILAETTNTLLMRDFNRDGILDALTVGGGIDFIRLGNSDGSFSLAISFDASVSTTGFERARAEDVNRDGILDLVTYGSSTTEVSVAFGNTDGSFAAAVSYQSGLANDLQIADVTGDGILDLVYSRAINSSVYVMQGNSNGSFSAATSFASRIGAAGLLVEDTNRDGRPDIVNITSGGELVFLAGNGNGTFGSITTRVNDYAYGQVAKRAAKPEDPNQPTKGLNLKNRAESALSVSILEKLKARIESDLKNVETVISELEGGFRFAQTGIFALQRVISDGFATSPEQIASLLTQQIRQLSRGSNIAQYSEIDSFLARELLGD